MRSVICTITLVVSAIAPGAHGNVPPGPDVINGAFVRVLAHEATSAAAQAVTTSDSPRTFERWVNRATRNEMRSLEAGFARMLVRPDQVPLRSIVRGEPDPGAVRIATALEAQRVDAQMLSRRARRPPAISAGSR